MLNFSYLKKNSGNFIFLTYFFPTIATVKKFVPYATSINHYLFQGSNLLWMHFENKWMNFFTGISSFSKKTRHFSIARTILVHKTCFSDWHQFSLCTCPVRNVEICFVCICPCVIIFGTEISFNWGMKKHQNRIISVLYFSCWIQYNASRTGQIEKKIVPYATRLPISITYYV